MKARTKSANHSMEALALWDAKASLREAEQCFYDAGFLKLSDTCHSLAKEAESLRRKVMKVPGRPKFQSPPLRG
jgi:Tfp pilus assembly protein PilX